MIPIGDWAEYRLRNLSQTDTIRFESRSKSGFGKNISNWLKRDKVYPTNIFHSTTECSNRGHSAVLGLSKKLKIVSLSVSKTDNFNQNHT